MQKRGSMTALPVNLWWRLQRCKLTGCFKIIRKGSLGKCMLCLRCCEWWPYLNFVVVSIFKEMLGTCYNLTYIERTACSSLGLYAPQRLENYWQQKHFTCHKSGGRKCSSCCRKYHDYLSASEVSISALLSTLLMNFFHVVHTFSMLFHICCNNFCFSVALQASRSCC